MPVCVNSSYRLVSRTARLVSQTVGLSQDRCVYVKLRRVTQTVKTYVYVEVEILTPTKHASGERPSFWPFFVSYCNISVNGYPKNSLDYSYPFGSIIRKNPHRIFP